MVVVGQMSDEDVETVTAHFRTHYERTRTVSVRESDCRRLPSRRVNCRRLFPTRPILFLWRYFALLVRHHTFAVLDAILKTPALFLIRAHCISAQCRVRARSAQCSRHRDWTVDCAGSCKWRASWSTLETFCMVVYGLTYRGTAVKNAPDTSLRASWWGKPC